MEYLHSDKELLTEDFLRNLHASTFDYIVEGDDFRVDGAFFAKENDDLFGYILYRELSSKKVELVYGGVAIKDRGFKTLKAYRQFLLLLSEKYSHVETLVVNTNYKMLKMYMALGFNVIGTKLQYKKNKVLVVLEKDLEIKTEETEQ